MENKEMEECKEVVGCEPTVQEVFDELAEVVRGNFIATFEKESDASLIMNFVGGYRFRLTVEKVTESK